MHTSCQHDHGAEEIKAEEKRIKELSIRQILDGDNSLGLHKGLITMAEEYMEINDWEDEQIEAVMKILHFMSAKACG